MTDEEAQAALVALRTHFKEPVLPLSKFCEAMTTWFRALEKNNTDEALRVIRDPHPWRPDNQHGHKYHEHIPKILVDIKKSNLLARLLFGGEKLRTEMCPTHKGHWSGTDCEEGCQGTGWLLPPDERPKTREKVGAWTSADETSDGSWWKWKRSDGAVVLCHMNGMQLKGWIAEGPGGGKQTFRKTPDGGVIMFDTAELARAAVDEKYPLK